MTADRLDASSILGFDPFAPTFLADPYAHYHRLRAGGALQRTPAGLLISPSYEVCVQILRDPRFGNRAQSAIDGDGEPGSGGTAARATRAFLFLEPPDHTRLRGLVSKAFSARMIERLRPRIERIVDRLLTDALRAGTADLVPALAYPLPVTVISELLGVPPAEQARFKAWSDALARGLDPVFLLPAEQIERQQRARLEIAEYFRGLAAERRADPRDDLLSALVSVEDDGDTLSEEELIATCVLLLVAGHETTVNLIGSGTLALLRDPERLAWFRAHPEAAPAVVEELLRYEPPVQVTGRVALEDVDLDVPGGARRVRVAAGELVLLLLGAANRDPAVFGDPDRLDFDRGARNGAAPPRHLSFGHGIHFCMGASLARLEGQVALTELTRRAPGLALATERPAYRENLVLRGPAELPVRLR